MISIVSAIWKRPALTEIFLDSLVRYRKDYGITAVVAGSEGEATKNMCALRGVTYIEVKNNPLSNKFVKASQKAAALHNPKALMILGSDDFVDNALIERYIRLLENGADVVGITDCYFYDTVSSRSVYWKGYTNFRKGETIGMARMLSMKVFNRLRGKLWPSNINSGLDYNMMKKLKSHKDLVREEFNVNGMMAVDIKGQGNITALNCYNENLSPVPVDVFDTIPEFERIKKL